MGDTEKMQFVGYTQTSADTHAEEDRSPSIHRHTQTQLRHTQTQIQAKLSRVPPSSDENRQKIKINPCKRRQETYRTVQTHNTQTGPEMEMEEQTHRDTER